MAISRERLNAYAASLQELSNRAQADLNATFELYQEAGLDEAVSQVVEAAYASSDYYGDMAATLAAEFFEEIAYDEEELLLDADLADTYDHTALDENIGYAAHNHLFGGDVDIDGFTSFIDNVIDTAVKSAARSTMTLNTSRNRDTGVKFARVPMSPTPCAFCIMLASRGFAYYSAESAGDLAEWHRNCNCEIIPSWSGEIEGYDPDKYLDQYFEGRKHAEGDSTSDILAAMRRYVDSDQIHDSVKQSSFLLGFDEGKITPMSFTEADGGKCNPGYAEPGGDTNCQTCVAVYEMRRRGYDVEALLNDDNEYMEELAENPWNIWRNPDDMGDIEVTDLGRSVREAAYNMIDDYVGNNGERYTIGVGNIHGEHVVSAERDDQGRLFIYDPQDGYVYKGQDVIERYFNVVDAIEIWRTDDAIVDTSLAERIMQRAS